MLVVVVVVCDAGAVLTTGAGVGRWTVVELKEQAATERPASTRIATIRI